MEVAPARKAVGVVHRDEGELPLRRSLLSQEYIIQIWLPRRQVRRVAVTVEHPRVEHYEAGNGFGIDEVFKVRSVSTPRLSRASSRDERRSGFGVSAAVHGYDVDARVDAKDRHVEGGEPEPVGQPGCHLLASELVRSLAVAHRLDVGPARVRFDLGRTHARVQDAQQPLVSGRRPGRRGRSHSRFSGYTARIRTVEKDCSTSPCTKRIGTNPEN